VHHNHHHHHHHPTTASQQQEQEQPSFLCGWLKLLPLPAPRNDNNKQHNDEEEDEGALLSSTSGASFSSSSSRYSASGSESGDVVRASYLYRKNPMNALYSQLTYIDRNPPTNTKI
jgi:hypothetical protein